MNKNNTFFIQPSGKNKKQKQQQQNNREETDRQSKIQSMHVCREREREKVGE